MPMLPLTTTTAAGTPTRARAVDGGLNGAVTVLLRSLGSVLTYDNYSGWYKYCQ